MRIMEKVLILVTLIATLIMPASALEDGKPNIQMNVLEIGQGSGSVAINTAHPWFIRCFLPEEFSQYTILQTLSSSLSYQDGSLQVMVIQGDNTSIPFVMELHYTVTSGTVFTEQGSCDRISITLTETGVSQLTKNAELRITYQASLREYATMEQQILGTAQLYYMDSEGNRVACTSERASLRTGGFPIQLTDPSGNPIAGSKFMLARKATSEELSDASETIELLDTGAETIAVTYVPFSTKADLSGDITYTAVSDAEGKTGCYGLAYGEYYLVQTNAGNDRFLPSIPIPVTVNEVSHLTLEDGWRKSSGEPTDKTIRIVNRNLTMPMTGGPGTRIYTLSGMLVILSACMLLWYNRKRPLSY